jgi:hypothetical protein
MSDQDPFPPKTTKENKKKPILVYHRIPAWSWFLHFLFITPFLFIVAIPFTSYAPQAKKLLLHYLKAVPANQQKTIVREVIKEIPVEKEVIREVIKTIEKPALPAELPPTFIPRKEVQVAQLYNGIKIQTDLNTQIGDQAAKERESSNAYQVQFSLNLRIPTPSASAHQLQSINPSLPLLLNDFNLILQRSQPSRFFYHLYDTKTSSVKNNLTQLNKLLDRHNYYDCDTILEAQHPQSQRKLLWIQSEMDVVSDGSDGDRLPKIDDYITFSDYYQPFTSYAWPKKGTTPNPLLSPWQKRLDQQKSELTKLSSTTEKYKELKNTIKTTELEITDLKTRSSLISEIDPFIVISLLFKPYNGHHSYAPQIGDYALVIHEDKIYPAICGDYGPTNKMGEASLKLAKAINPNANPYRRPENDLKVSYIIFPNTAERPFTTPNLLHWQEKCQDYLNEIGGLLPSYQLHLWEEPPAPTPVTPVTPATPATPATPPIPLTPTTNTTQSPAPATSESTPPNNPTTKP